MMINELKDLIFENLKQKTKEAQRLFHGRGNFYKGLSFLTIDSLGDILYICFFEEQEKSFEKELFKLFDEVYDKGSFKSLVFQRRYLSKSPCEIIKGSLEDELFVYENDLMYSINFSNKNFGLFLDMKRGREFVFSKAKDKKVLNLFSYTCAFSVNAMAGGAKSVVNVDMAKGALSIGRKNHQINSLDTKKVQFMPYNILKSWSRIKKAGPYDLIVIDPPSFQKGSFAATKDYEKIIKRLDELANENCIVLSCLNAPELDTSFIKGLFSTLAPSFSYIKRLENLESFPCIDEQKSLKNLIFKRTL